MSTSRPFLALTALLLAGSAGCDAEAPGGGGPIDYRAVGHVDIDAVKTAPWMKGALKDGKLEVHGELGACEDVVQKAKTVTFGAKEDAFEVYIGGSFGADEANACADFIDAKVAAEAGRLDGKPKPEATLLAEGVFVVFGGGLTPSRDRLEDLMDADPSSGQPMWVTANMTGKGKPVERFEAWADPTKGMKAHAEVVFADEAKASEIYGQAVLGLTAMRMSDEVGELASAVDLDSSGKSMTAEVSLSTAQMKTLVAKSQARHEAHADFHARHHGGKGGHGKKGSGVEIRIETK